ncbi:thymidine kinase [bacterium]|nr:thymidine kinase [bacterium]
MAKVNAFGRQKGWIEVICGPMFAGKSEELLRRINLLKYSEAKYLLFTPTKDTRSGGKRAKSRDGREFTSISVEKAIDIIGHVNKASEIVQVVAIDEAQFFDEELCNVCNYLANNNYIVLVAGLDMDFDGNPFKTMTNIITVAEKVTKLKAICMTCGAEASFSERLKSAQKKQGGRDQIMIGDIESYEARCRHCHTLSKANP